MSLIAVQTPETATGATAEMFEQFRQMLGSVPLPLQMMGISPPLLSAFASTVGYFHGGQQELDPLLLTWIRYLNAHRQACHFCVDMNAGMLLQMGVTLQQLAMAREAPATIPLPDKEKTMLLFVLEVIQNDKGATPEAIAALRAHGYSERAIFECVAAAATSLYLDTLMNVFQVEE